MSQKSALALASESIALPEFANPPLDEVVIGVQFGAIRGFTAAHPGLYWSTIRDRYPSLEEAPPLPHQKELSELKPAKGERGVLQLGASARCWFISPDGTSLIQLQSDQFLRNWRRVVGTETYPRYPTLLDEFRKEWKGFRQFLEQEGLGDVAVDQCELTYINQAEFGADWPSFAELDRVFTFLRPPTRDGLLVDPEYITWKGAYKLPDDRGRLHVDLRPAFRGRDFKMVVNLNLKAKGDPATRDPDQVFDWFNMAHEWVVRGFAELTQPSMHAIWKRLK